MTISAHAAPRAKSWEMKRSTRKDILDAVYLAVAKATQSGHPVYPDAEAKRLAEKYPKAGMSEVEVRDFLFEIAVARGLGVSTMA